MDHTPLPEVGPHEADLSQLLDGLTLLEADSVVAIAAARAQSAPDDRRALVAAAEQRARASGRAWEAATERAGLLAEQLAAGCRLEPEAALALRSALREAVLALVTWDLSEDEARDLFLPVAEFFPIAHSERAG
ncbi:MAG: hypothetical protein DLM67_10670 [Candidatus Nephthysia bennettiae]|uniref:Uncharacterized protein n=1 Tax=Candidatus Nephthysia bennettiae TaxID=3127016 RepID=A0A934K2B4_9BACT|nr:hypothetical protein [Candidatus Dormibacteraeota bacterium]MBJ7613819.1 hypothetical protein [Candidatus Dormibacteraeota bacterium]PZR95581.1 MAG: hypothetical protein DLM67_10670 [Candidatus Dormibacteraeota bacterium]